MQRCAAQNNFATSAEMKEMGRLRAAFMREKCEAVVICPKPRRFGLVNHPTQDFVKPLRWQRSHTTEVSESKAGVEILDIILSKSGCGEPPNLGCSPPYFCGSPPSRADNPLVHDVQFNHQRMSPSPSALSKPKSCSRPSFGPTPAVRVEGFDCLDRDTRCSISAMA